MKRAVHEARSFGLEVLGVVVLVDRREGGAEAVTELGVTLDSIFTLEDLRLGSG